MTRQSVWTHSRYQSHIEYRRSPKQHHSPNGDLLDLVLIAGILVCIVLLRNVHRSADQRVRHVRHDWSGLVTSKRLQEEQKSTVTDIIDTIHEGFENCG